MVAQMEVIIVGKNYEHFQIGQLSGRYCLFANLPKLDKTISYYKFLMFSLSMILDIY